MTKPLALLVHEKLMPGSQLVSKFERMDYRVATMSDPADLPAAVAKQPPMLVVADLANRRGDVLQALGAMLAAEGSGHIPVIAYTSREDEKVRDAAAKMGIKLLATDATIVQHLEQFVEAALLVD